LITGLSEIPSREIIESVDQIQKFRNQIIHEEKTKGYEKQWFGYFASIDSFCRQFDKLCTDQFSEIPWFQKNNNIIT
jgi:hypothetical protein